MWNLILIQILLNDTAFKNTFDHFLELGIFAVVTKYGSRNCPNGTSRVVYIPWVIPRTKYIARLLDIIHGELAALTCFPFPDIRVPPSP